MHTEGREYTLKPLETDPNSVLALVGDIGTLRASSRLVHFLKQCNDRGFRKVFYVLGNHEAYHEDINLYINKYRELLATNGLTNVVLLENETYDFPEERVRFIGTTLWTDCNKDNWFFYQAIKDRMNDFHLITNGMHRLTPQKSYEFFNKAAGYIKAVCSNTDDEWKKVLLCHHGVTMQSVPPKFKGDALNHAFVSELSQELVDWGIDLCVHGHTHHSVDYMVGDKCRVVSNQVGYYKENPNFVDKVVEI